METNSDNQISKRNRLRDYVCRGCGHIQQQCRADYKKGVTNPVCLKCNGGLIKQSTLNRKARLDTQDRKESYQTRPVSKLTCPVHNAKLSWKMTKYGRRYFCEEPGCTVVCWDGKTSTPADQETRTLRNQVHQQIDPLWQDGKLSKSVIYDKIAEHLGLKRKDTHIGFFNAEQCLAVLDLVKTLEWEQAPVPEPLFSGSETPPEAAFDNIPPWEEVPVFSNDYSCNNLI